MRPTRPALRWHGGKWRLAPWIIGHFPAHRTYTEVYGGAASVLLRKPRAFAEVYNDLDDEVVTLFRCLQDTAKAARLHELLMLTPFARREFEDAYAPSDDPVETARHLIIRTFMGFGSDGHNAAIRTGFRADSNRSNTTPAHDWANYPAALPFFIERMRGVVIEHRPALQVLKRADDEDALHYLDPPYHPELRSKKSRRGKIRYHAYKHEMTDDDHAELLEAIRGLRGMVVLSGYPSKMYDGALKGWDRVERAAMADGAKPRVEVLWINPHARVRLGDGPLFEIPISEAAE